MAGGGRGAGCSRVYRIARAGRGTRRANSPRTCRSGSAPVAASRVESASGRGRAQLEPSGRCSIAPASRVAANREGGGQPLLSGNAPVICCTRTSPAAHARATRRAVTGDNYPRLRRTPSPPSSPARSGTSPPSPPGHAPTGRSCASSSGWLASGPSAAPTQNATACQPSSARCAATDETENGHGGFLAMPSRRWDSSAATKRTRLRPTCAASVGTRGWRRTAGMRQPLQELKLLCPA
jgi:hypothetical protein